MKGKDIKAYRASLGMTQEQLAKRFGVAANTVARWERDESIPDGAGMLELAFRGLEIERGLDSTGEIAALQKKVMRNLRKADEAAIR
jgi:transcriptional regulator with XRE-family HTH domain